MSHFKIDLTTGDKFWTPKGLGALGMDPNRAISELVANSLDWRVDGDQKTIIKIIIDNNSIEIVDNGVGMNEEELQNGIKVSVANDDLRPNLRVRKGMFGMGMKVACLTLGWKISIHSRSIKEENKEHSFILDTRKLDGNNQDYRNNIYGKTTMFEKNSSLGEYRSGTSIKVEDLTYKSLTGVSIRDSLQEVFKPELNLENIEIIVIDRKRDEEFICQRVETNIIENSKINLDELNLFVTPENSTDKVQIKGWLALMEISRPGGEWGLHLYKNNQIIERFHQLPKRLGGLMTKNPHAEVSRTYGEIQLDMCPPAFHKVGFDHSSPEWIKVQNLLEEHISEIMESSVKYKKSDKERAAEAISRIQKHRRAAKNAAKKLKSHIEDKNKPESAITLNDGRWFTIVSPIFKELNDKNTPWLYNFSTSSSELSIIINVLSPIYCDITNRGLDEKQLEYIVNWAITDCVLFFLMNEFEYKNSEAQIIRNNLLNTLYF